jgi:hypothetical protein
MFMDKPVHLVLAHDVVSGKSEHVMRVGLAWQPGLDITKQRQHNERGDRPDNGCKPKADPDQNADSPVTQIEAAVVRPRTVKPSLKITPAPRNPVPVIIP